MDTEYTSKNGATIRHTSSKEHTCDQSAEMAVICEKLENIESAIIEIKSANKIFMEKFLLMSVDQARYPTAEALSKSLSLTHTHDLYFKIMWVLLGGAWGFVIFILDKLWKG